MKVRWGRILRLEVYLYKISIDYKGNENFTLQCRNRTNTTWIKFKVNCTSNGTKEYHVPLEKIQWEKNTSLLWYFRIKSSPGYNQEEILSKHTFRKLLQNDLQKCQVPESPADWGILLDHERFDSWAQCCPELTFCYEGTVRTIGKASIWEKDVQEIVMLLMQIFLELEIVWK